MNIFSWKRCKQEYALHPYLRGKDGKPMKVDSEPLILDQSINWRQPQKKGRKRKTNAVNINQNREHSALVFPEELPYEYAVVPLGDTYIIQESFPDSIHHELADCCNLKDTDQRFELKLLSFINKYGPLTKLDDRPEKNLITQWGVWNVRELLSEIEEIRNEINESSKDAIPVELKDRLLRLANEKIISILPKEEEFRINDLGYLALAKKPRDLLDFIYLKIVEDISGKLNVTRCLRCNKPLKHGRSDMKTCSNACRKYMQRHPELYPESAPDKKPITNKATLTNTKNKTSKHGASKKNRKGSPHGKKTTKTS